MLCPSNFIEISGKMHELMGFSGFPLGIWEAFGVKSFWQCWPAVLSDGLQLRVRPTCTPLPTPASLCQEPFLQLWSTKLASFQRVTFWGRALVTTVDRNTDQPHWSLPRAAHMVSRMRYKWYSSSWKGCQSSVNATPSFLTLCPSSNELLNLSKTCGFTFNCIRA